MRQIDDWVNRELAATDCECVDASCIVCRVVDWIDEQPRQFYDSALVRAFPGASATRLLAIKRRYERESAD